MPDRNHHPPQSTIHSTLGLPIDAFDVVIRDGANGVAIVTKDHSGPLPGSGRTAVEHQQAVRRENDWLQAAAGIDGIVSSVEVTTEGGEANPVGVTTRFAGSQTLRSATLTPAETIRALAAVCDSLIQLQQRQLQHGAVSPEHVIIASDGRGVLCSPNTSLSADDHLEDLLGLGQCISFCLERWARRSKPPVNLASWLVLAKRLESEDPLMTPRRAAAMIRGLAETSSSKSLPFGPWRLLAGAMAATVGIGLLLAVALSGGESVTGPQLRVRDALIRVGSIGQVAVALEPPAGCPGAEIYVLDPVTSWVWTFDDIDADSAGTLMVQIAGADGLHVERENRRCPVVIASGPAGHVEVPPEKANTE